jgi:hypothetical protein
MSISARQNPDGEERRYSSYLQVPLGSGGSQLLKNCLDHSRHLDGRLLYLMRTMVAIECQWGNQKEGQRTKGVVSTKSAKKINLRKNLCYLAFKKRIEPQKEGLLRG